MDLPDLHPFPGYPRITGTPDTPLDYNQVHVVRLYYGAWVAPPKRPGELAIEVRLLTDAVLAAELAASLSRTDIGLVEVTQLDTTGWGPWGSRRPLLPA